MIRFRMTPSQTKFREKLKKHLLASDVPGDASVIVGLHNRTRSNQFLGVRFSRGRERHRQWRTHVQISLWKWNFYAVGAELPNDGAIQRRQRRHAALLAAWSVTTASERAAIRARALKRAASETARRRILASNMDQPIHDVLHELELDQRRGVNVA